MDVTDIEGTDGWKKEVERLLIENDYLKKEVVGSQLIAAYALRVAGRVVVPKDEVAEGLPGYSIDMQEEGENLVFTLKEPDAEQ